MHHKKEFAVLGLGRFGSSVAISLAQRGYDVLAVDSDPDIVAHVAGQVTNAMRADVSDEVVLRSLGLGNFDVVVVAIGRDWEGCILATLIAKELGVKTVIAKAATEMQKRILEKVGADKVVFPEKEMGSRVANNLICGTMFDFPELTKHDRIAEIPVLPEWFGKTLANACMRAKYGLNVLCIIRQGNLDASVGADTVLNAGDKLLVIGKTGSIEKIIDRIV